MAAADSVVDEHGYSKYPDNPVPYFMAERIYPSVRVPDKYMDCIVFVGVFYDGIFTPHGTGFIVIIEQDGHVFQHVVTARHVIDRISLPDVYIRVNLVEGGVDLIKTRKAGWMNGDDKSGRTYLDVAAFPIGLDSKKYKIQNVNIATSMLMEDDAATQDIGIGEDVFFMGLHTSHFGQHENIPVVRFGNLAAVSEEPFATEFGLVIGYLVEVRSIGGSSGSPVYISVPPFRVLEGKVTQSSKKTAYFLGMMVGTWIASNPSDAVGEDERRSVENINTGIAIVVPAQEILKMMTIPIFVKMRAEVIEKHRAEAAKNFRFSSVPQNPPKIIEEKNPTGDEILKAMLSMPPAPHKGAK